MASTTASEYFSLSSEMENDHSSFLMRHISQAFKSQHYVDVILICQKTTFYAHKLVLAAFSSRIASWIEESNMTHPSQESLMTFDLQEYVGDAATMEAVLHFMYYGKYSSCVNSMAKLKQAMLSLGIGQNYPNESSSGMHNMVQEESNPSYTSDFAYEEKPRCVPKCVDGKSDQHVQETAMKVEYPASSVTPCDGSDVSNTADCKIEKAFLACDDRSAEGKASDLSFVIKNEVEIHTDTDSDYNNTNRPSAVKSHMSTSDPLSNVNAVASQHKIGDDSTAISQMSMVKCKDSGFKVASVGHKKNPKDFAHKCMICGLYFRNKPALYKHEMVHKNNKEDQDLNCIICSKSFNTRDSLRIHFQSSEHRQHMLDFISNERQQPKRSKKQQMQESSPAVKRTTDSSNYCHKCLECPKVFADHKDLSNHQMFHTAGNMFECSPCGQGFPSEICLLAHQQVEHASSAEIHEPLSEHSAGESGMAKPSTDDDSNQSINTHTPVVAPSQILSPKDLVTSELEPHRGDGLTEESSVWLDVEEEEEEEEEEKEENEEKEMEEETCDKEMDVNTLKVLEMKDMPDEGRFQCRFCMKILKHKSTFIKHEKSHIGPFNYKCEYCGKDFTYKSRMDAHVGTVHKKDRSFLCPRCGKIFPSHQALKDHINIHDDNRAYKCTHCDKAFYTRPCLNAHEEGMHSGVLHLCTICGKQFARPSGLKDHMSVHSSERKYSCAICNNSFKTSGILRMHKKIHGKREASHTCPTCGKCFYKMSLLNSHMVFHGQKEFVCSTCGKSFFTKSALKDHNVLHSGVKPHICPICGKASALMGNLKKHMRIHQQNN